MPLLKKPGFLLNAALYIITGLLIIAAVGGALTHKPFLLTVIRSGSMNPTLKRGDAVIIQRVDENTRLAPGDVIVFRSEGGSLAAQGWIMHRIVSGDAKTGYITQGDNNDETDQESGGSLPIKQEWVVSRALVLGGVILKIPLIGYIPLWLEHLQTHPMLLPGIAVTLAFIVAVDDLMGKKKRGKKRANRNLEQQLLYFFSGLTIAVILAGSTLASSQHLRLEYEVSPNSKGVIMGSPVGIMQQGEVVERRLSELKNNGFIPIVASITTHDQQIRFSHDLLKLAPGQKEQITMTVSAQEPGKYKSSIWIGLFYPLLPAGLIHYLARKSFWLALAVLTMLPALPLILLPVLEPRLRLQTKKEIRRTLRRVSRRLPFTF
jgi:signal peptidase